MLVKAGADLNKRFEVRLSGTRGTTEATPIVIAVWGGHADVVDLLLKAGANVAAKDSFKRTAFDWARLSRKPAAPEILSLLEHAGAEKPSRTRPIQLQPDFSAAAARPEFHRVLSELRKLTHKSPRPLLAANGTPVAGGFFFAVPEVRRAAFVAQHQERLLRRECFLFWTREQSKAREAAVGIVPTADFFEVVAALQTNGANCRIYNEEIVKQMRNLSYRHPFALAGVGFDFLAGRFFRPVRDSDRLAKRLCKLCPDLEDPDAVARQLKQTGDFFLWWG